MFFKLLTWPQFWCVALLLLAVWYGWVWWKYWRGGGPSGGDVGSAAGAGSEKLPHHWDGQVEVMGQRAEDPGVEIVSTDDYGFAGLPGGGLDRESQQGLVPDVQEDIRSICRLIAEEDGTKEEFFSMFGLIRSKYPLPALREALPQLNVFIREQVSFLLTPDELDRLWT